MTRRELMALARRVLREPDLEDEEALGGMECLFCGAGMYLRDGSSDDSPRVCDGCAQDKLSEMAVAVIALLKRLRAAA